MKIILAVDENFGIGKDNKLLFHLKKDLEHFKKITLNSIVIMGRKTYQSMGKALTKRENIVLSKDKDFRPKDALVFDSKDKILKYLQKNKEKEVFVIGGGQIVDLFLEDCNEAIITKVLEKKDADTFLYNFDEDKSWEIVEKSDIEEENGHKFIYVTYKKTK